MKNSNKTWKQAFSEVEAMHREGLKIQLKNLINYLENNNITYKNNNFKLVIIPNTSDQIEYLEASYDTTISNSKLLKTFIIEVDLNK